MNKFGLKLWSINIDFYFEEAKKLYAQGFFDYTEIYVVPGTLDTIKKWQTIGIPITLHAPHFAHGVNLAKKESEAGNIDIYKEVKLFADKLDVPYIVFHGGVDGDIKETARQLKAFDDPRILLENKPYRALPNRMKGEFCRGATKEEIEFVMGETGCGFCLDFGHAICSANSLKIEPYEYVVQLNTLAPTCYHLSDNFADNELDKHLHFGEGNYDLGKLLKIADDGKNIAIETSKNSKENLNDFVKDVTCLKNLS